jgi:GNAT superfamily N-acetyltransferase
VLELKVVTVNASSGQELFKFIKYPLSLYSQSPYYVPHLLLERKNLFNPRKNPFFKHAEVEYYLALSDNGEVLGRISAQVDWNYVRFQEEKSGFFGFFDCVDNAEVAGALFEKVCDFHRKKGMESVLGPMNFNTNDELGLLVNGFDTSPYFMMPYNYSYYRRLIEICGYDKAKDLYAYHVKTDGTVPEFITRISARVKKRYGIYLRRFNLKNFDSDLQLVNKIYNSAWEKNWGFVPRTDEDIEYIAADLKQIVDPSLAFFAYVGDQPAGFFLALPDYNLIFKKMKGRLFPFGFLKILLGRRKINRMRVLVMGVVEEHRKSGIEAAMLEEIYRVGPLNGYFEGEISWILEDNVAMNRIISRLVSEPYKTYRIYGKRL